MAWFRSMTPVEALDRELERMHDLLDDTARGECVGNAQAETYTRIVHLQDALIRLAENRKNDQLPPV